VGDEQDLVRFLQQIGRNEGYVHCLLRVACQLLSDAASGISGSANQQR
jgi:hypothetical protein